MASVKPCGLLVEMYPPTGFPAVRYVKARCLCVNVAGFETNGPPSEIGLRTGPVGGMEAIRRSSLGCVGRSLPLGRKPTGRDD